ncbi:MAG: SlyX family protein [Rugosibacter sp.]|jgi:SlyX protein|nr:SlyX protein [Rugosibacter sp.]
MDAEKPREQQINELEIKLNLAEDAIDALNRTVFRQQQQMDLLQAQMRALYRQLQSADAAGPTDTSQAPADARAEIPPHY